MSRSAPAKRQPLGRMQRDQRFFCPPTCPNKWYFGSNNFGPPQTALRAFSGPAGPKNGFFGRILLRHGRTEGRTEKTWTCIGKLSQSRRKKVIVTKCVARTVFPLRTVERRPWSIVYPLKKHKTGRFSPIRSRNHFFQKRDPYPNGKCLLFCQNNVWVR